MEEPTFCGNLRDRNNLRFSEYIELFQSIDDTDMLFPKPCRACGRNFYSISDYICYTSPKGHSIEDASGVMQKTVYHDVSPLCLRKHAGADVHRSNLSAVGEFLVHGGTGSGRDREEYSGSGAGVHEPMGAYRSLRPMSEISNGKMH